MKDVNKNIEQRNKWIWNEKIINYKQITNVLITS